MMGVTLKPCRYEVGQQVIVIGFGSNVFQRGSMATIIKCKNKSKYLVEYASESREWLAERYLALPYEADERRVLLVESINRWREALRTLGKVLGKAPNDAT